MVDNLSRRPRPAALPPGVDLPRLTRAMQRGRAALQKFRQERVEAVRQYVGSHWSDDGAPKAVPLNLIAQYVRVVGRSLVSKAPRLMLSTFDKDLKPAVAATEEWANRQVGRMHLGETLQRVVLDALFSVGVCKVALAGPTDAAQAGWGIAAGQPYAERVDLDDFVFDVYARDFAEVSFVGHRYRCTLAAANEVYRKGLAERLTADEAADYNAEGDERIGLMGRGSGARDEFEDMVTLWEVYLPRHRLVVTLLDSDMEGASEFAGGPLRVQKWVGPYCGPYHVLAYGVVPGSAMPKAPVQDLIDLHHFVNRSLRKVMRQVDRQKSVLPYRGGNTEDAARLTTTDDGTAFQCDDPAGLKELSFGGPNQGVFLAANAFRDLFSKFAGNLDLMAGSAPQSKTAAQDEMLNQNAGGQTADMQETTVGFASQVCEALCWYWWNHPQQTMDAPYQPVPGGVVTPRSVSPRQRQRGRWDDLDVRVDPYSLGHKTPQQRLAMLTQVVTQIVAPFAGLLQQQGVMLDMNALLQKIARLGDMPDLGEVVTIQEPVAPGPGGDGGDAHPGMPASTTRNYVRRSAGNGDNAAQAAVQNTLAAAGAGEQMAGPVGG